MAVGSTAAGLRYNLSVNKDEVVSVKKSIEGLEGDILMKEE